MFRTHTCGELRISDVNKQVTLSGMVQRAVKWGHDLIVLREPLRYYPIGFNEE